MLFGQLWTNTISYGYWIIDSESELIELSSSEEKEGESEEEKKEKEKEEKEDKIRSGFSSKNSSSYLSIFITNHSKDYLTLHHPENTTPTPQSTSLIF